MASIPSFWSASLSESLGGLVVLRLDGQDRGVLLHGAVVVLEEHAEALPARAAPQRHCERADVLDLEACAWGVESEVSVVRTPPQNTWVTDTTREYTTRSSDIIDNKLLHTGSEQVSHGSPASRTLRPGAVSKCFQIPAAAAPCRQR